MSVRLLLPWYFLGRPQNIVQRYIAYAEVCAEMFSFIFLLRTLFAPWKNIRDDYPVRGFQLGKILETLTFNVVTRVIGALIRLSAIVIGLCIQLLLFVGFAIYLVVWVTFPILFIVGIFFVIGLL